MEYLIMSGLTAVIIGLLYAVVKQKQKETVEWKKRKARKAQIDKRENP
jgi:heme exporter protein D